MEEQGGDSLALQVLSTTNANKWPKLNTTVTNGTLTTSKYTTKQLTTTKLIPVQLKTMLINLNAMLLYRKPENRC